MSARVNRQSPLLPILLPLSILIVIGLVLYGFSRILLQVTPTAATVVALIAAGTVMGAAAFVATREHVSAASMFSLVGAVGGVAMLAGGLAVVAFPLHEAGPEAQPATLTAGPTASVDGFSTDKLSVGSDVPIDLTFENKESGVQHNVVIFDGDDDKAPQLFSGTLVTGVASTTYHVPSLPEGTYFFHCEVHPSTMVGEITAAPAAGGEGGGGPTVVAQNLTFDTTEIDLPAQPTTLHFENQDAGTVHNIGIYTDDSASQALFDGADVTGPDSADYQVPALDPGEYYFRCDTHPQMNGTVVVSGGPGGAEGGGGGDQGGGGGGGDGG
jgi:plastocyanin